MPDMISQVNLHAQVAPTGVVVPNQTVSVDENGHRFVYVAEGGKAACRQIKTGPLSRSGVTVLAGLRPQDQLIASGFQRLSSGEPLACSVVK